MGMAAFLLLGAFAYSQPAERATSREAAYEHSGIFSYGGLAPIPWLYDDDRVTTGDPLFRQLSNSLEVSFAYRFTSTSPHDIRGSYNMAAVISDTAGWKRTVPLQETTPFEGDAVTLTGILDLDNIQQTINNLEAETGLKRDHYEVAVVPQVQAAGAIAGQALNETFAPRLGFRIDPLQLQMLPAGPREPDPRTPTQTGTAEIARIEPNTLSILALKLNVADARRLTALGICLSLMAGLFFGWRVWKRMGEDEPSRIRARFGDQIVDVREGPPARGAKTVQLTAIEDLAKIADRLGSVIHHERHNDTHVYSVLYGDISYRYQTASGPAERRRAAMEVPG